jgi:S1-C subfamily serine protease/Flp pilus assembly protein TadD
MDGDLKHLSMKNIFPYIFFFCFAMSKAQPSAEKVFENVSDAVVRIFTYHHDYTSRGQGSGVIIKDKGWVITNYHVLGDAEIIHARHNGQNIHLDSIIAMDAEKDVLILQLNKEFLKKYDKTIPSIKIGNSKKLKVGQKVYAIGSPFGFENTMTDGIISGLRSSYDSTKKFIQISAPISSGSSGGAVVNEKGELIGISTLVISGGNAQNLNFALAIDEVLETATAPKKVNERANSTLVNYYFQNGRKDFYQKKYKSAIFNLKNAMQYVEKEDSKAVIYYYTGLAFQKLNMVDSATAYYNLSLENRKISDTYVALGTISLDAGNYDKAIALFEQALKLNPNFNEALVSMGTAYYRKSDYLTALQYLQRAVAVSPNNPKAHFLLGNISVVIKKYDLAILFYHQAIYYNPTFAEAYMGLYKAYQLSGETQKAEANRRRALELNPKLVTPD